MAKDSVIQRLQLTDYRGALHCPFCGKKVIAASDLEVGDRLSPCPHTLFVATDLGFEFKGKTLKSLGLEADSCEQVGYDSCTDQLPVKDCIKFVIHAAGPTFFVTYVGFCPVVPEE